MALTARPTARQPTALVLRALGLGDLLTAVPALRGVAAALPGHRLVVATYPPLAPVVDLIGCVDELVPARELEPLQWDRPAPDVAVNLHGRGPQSHRVLQQLDAGRLVAFASPELGIGGPDWVGDEHEAARWARLVESELGVRVPADDLPLDPPVVPPLVADAVVVHPGAASESRRWPARRFAQVARHLDRRGHDVVVTGSRDEAPLAGWVAAEAGLPQSAVLAGSTSVDELANLVARARLVVSGDTGVAHLATAFAVPSVVLFGPVSPSLWGPATDGPHVCLWHGTEESAGDPHGADVDPALARIQPTEVVDAAESLLAANHSTVR